MKNYLSLLALVLVVSAAPVQAESVYKWTDKDGVTHYGDRQPQGQESESVDVVSGTSRSTNSEDGKKGGESGRLSPQERLKTLQADQQETREQASKSRAKEARDKQRIKNCEIARDALKKLNTYGRIKVEEDGEQRYLTPEEIEAKKAEYQKIEADACTDQ
jgi:hypothetical protein